MAIYSSLRWRRRNSASSLPSVATSPRPAVNEDLLLGLDPGQIIIYDYTPQKSSFNMPDMHAPIKCIQWNIERGYRLDAVISTLRSYEADIICLQELDVHCARSTYRNAAKEIAEALQMTCLFIVEFEELYSRKRSPRTQGGGWHGNAILTRFPIHSHYAIAHTHHPVDWEREGERMGEPRRGQRVTLCAILDVYGRKVAVYTAHLEVFCGILGRLKQFKDILEDSHRLLQGHDDTKIPHQLIFGDLNTMGHGVARLHPRFCRDSLRWRTMGSSEAAWWHRHLFSFTTADGEVNERLRRFRFSEADLKILRNPHFYDPVPQLHNTLRSVRGFFQGRLDWTLVRGLRAVDYGLDNHDYRKSDHKLMWVDVEFVNDGNNNNNNGINDDTDENGAEVAISDPGPLCYQEQVALQVIRTDFFRRTFWLILFLVAVLAYTFGSMGSK